MKARAEMGSRLHQRAAIVTGGGSGIGAACAQGLAREGACVVVADADGASALRVAAAIRAEGGQAVGFDVDVRGRESVEALLGSALEHFPRIHILHSNAGISRRCDFLEISQEQWDDVLKVNLTGQFVCGQVIGRHMRMLAEAASSTPRRSWPKGWRNRAWPTTWHRKGAFER
jgi:meso-butanediol dehydrogenase/(S,S)-butanediol dehydrogenase/diacetyl reductase